MPQDSLLGNWARPRFLTTCKLDESKSQGASRSGDTWIRFLGVGNQWVGEGALPLGRPSGCCHDLPP